MGGSQGQGSDIEIQAREILRMRTELEDLLAQHTGQPREKVSRDIDRDNIMMPEEALAYGLIDTVLGNRKKSLQTASAA
jgi:ATP-dependent Clp protease protease subunit